ncbi:MAG: NUDIX hydrolase [Microbacteriaceae bacterium]|nr:NUDIX hydrolase [Microbacteriaceae bacterium]
MLVVRDSPFQVLMVRRNGVGMFADAFVFPGGAVEASDRATAGIGPDPAEDARRRAASRETQEEAGIRLERLEPFARWITPVGAPRRWDTWFYLATARAGEVARPDGAEVLEAVWVEPGLVVDDRERRIVFPTLANLMLLAQSASTAAAFAAAASRPRLAVVPEVVRSPEGRLARIPPEAGYPIREHFTPAENDNKS